MATATPELRETLDELREICQRLQRCAEAIHDTKNNPQRHSILTHAVFALYLELRELIGPEEAQTYLETTRRLAADW